MVVTPSNNLCRYTLTIWIPCFDKVFNYNFILDWHIASVSSYWSIKFIHLTPIKWNTVDFFHRILFISVDASFSYKTKCSWITGLTKSRSSPIYSHAMHLLHSFCTAFVFAIFVFIFFVLLLCFQYYFYITGWL